jgi:hypothetical protein
MFSIIHPNVKPIRGFAPNPTFFFVLTQRRKQEKSSLPAEASAPAGLPAGQVEQNEPPAGPGKTSTFCMAHAPCLLDGCACANKTTMFVNFYEPVAV